MSIAIRKALNWGLICALAIYVATSYLGHKAHTEARLILGNTFTPNPMTTLSSCWLDDSRLLYTKSEYLGEGKSETRFAIYDFQTLKTTDLKGDLLSNSYYSLSPDRSHLFYERVKNAGRPPAVPDTLSSKDAYPEEVEMVLATLSNGEIGKRSVLRENPHVGGYMSSSRRIWQKDGKGWVFAYRTEETGNDYFCDMYSFATGKCTRTIRIKRPWSSYALENSDALIFVNEGDIYNTRKGAVEVETYTFQGGEAHQKRFRCTIPENLNIFAIRYSPDKKSILWLLSPIPDSALGGIGGTTRTAYDEHGKPYQDSVRAPDIKVSLWVCSSEGTNFQKVTEYDTSVDDSKHFDLLKTWAVSWLPSGKAVSYYTKEVVYIVPVNLPAGVR